MKVKVPNPYEQDTSKYFECTPDQGVRCIGAALSIDSQTHVVICAPDVVALKRAWTTMTTQPLDLKKAPILLYRYQTDMDKLQRDQLEDFKEEIKSKVLKNTSNTNPWFWYYYPHPKRGKCFIEESSFVPDNKEILLGEAKNCSEVECKLLLRTARIPRGIIDTIVINTSIDNLIPF